MSGAPARPAADPGAVALEALRRAAVARLRAAHVESPELDARVLLCRLLNIDEASLVAVGERPVAPDLVGRFECWLARRVAGEPVARIVGYKEFWSRAFRLGPATLVPRPESETVVEAALEACLGRERPLRVLDLGTGTGILLAAVLLERPYASGIGIDRSAAALAVARGNLEALGVGMRAGLICGDWGGALDQLFDLVVANPPYICSKEIAGLPQEVRSYDPGLALDGGADGLHAYRRIVAQLPRLLTAKGIAVLELGLGQETAVTGLARSAGLLVSGPARCDLAGVPRALIVASTG